MRCRCWSCGIRCPPARRPAPTLGGLTIAADAARWAGEPERGLALVEAALGEARRGRRPGGAPRCCCAAPASPGIAAPGQVDDLQAALRPGRCARTGYARRSSRQLSWALRRQDRHEEAERAAEEMTVPGPAARRRGSARPKPHAHATISAREGHGSLTALQSARDTAGASAPGCLRRSLRRLSHVLEGVGDHQQAIQAGTSGLARAKQLGLATIATRSQAIWPNR